MIRLQKWLAEGGVASRRKAEEIISAGRVQVNGLTVTQLGVKINPKTDTVTLDGKAIGLQKKVYIMFHKPEGVVTTASDPHGRKTVTDFMPPELGRLYPVGRLDYDTSGLLFMTNDGDWAYRLTHPKHKVNKTYIAVVKGVPDKADMEKFSKGLIIDGKKTASSQIRLDAVLDGGKSAKMSIVIHEGRNRQVRKMCEAIGFPVISLKRVAIGDVKLGGLKRGEWRFLCQEK